MTRKQIEAQFFGVPHLPAPHGGQYFAALKNTLSTSGVQWMAELLYLDSERGDLHLITRRAAPKRHRAMRDALDGFDGWRA